MIKNSVGNTKPKFSEEVLKQVREWNKLSTASKDEAIRKANVKTQIKIASLYGMLALAMLGYVASGGHVIAQAAGIVVLGLFAIPFVRVFMHSQAHWKIGNGPIRNFLLDHGLSMLFSIQQSGYKLGHFAHHLYDNDFDPRGFPKDLQSSYVFSKDGKPANMLLWCLFYVGIYQSAVHIFHVMNTRKLKVAASFVFETLLIAGFHYGMYSISSGFYFGVYLPALAIAWTVAAIALYMMHAVELDKFTFYHAINCLDPFFNWFGDNDGYHIEHSLFPNVHPLYLKEANALIKPPKSQEIHENYVIAGIKRIFTQKITTTASVVQKATA